MPSKSALKIVPHFQIFKILTNHQLTSDVKELCILGRIFWPERVYQIVIFRRWISVDEIY